MNWYKISQAESWYTEEVAKNTDDPEILRKIIEKGNYDYVSYNAIKNPNCPPEILAEILKRGNNDFVSLDAARNPNCPPEILAEILKKGKDNWISQLAAQNPNCPPEAKLDWYRTTGRLTTYDPTKHVIDKVEPKEDKDLKELENLLAKNNNWYKKSQNIYRGDPNPINIKDFDSEYATKQLGKELASSLSYGPGIYFVTKEEYAQLYGNNISKFNINNAKILTKNSKKLNYKQIVNIINSIDKNKLEIASSNWNENYEKGKQIIIQNIANESNPIYQLMSIWSDVFAHQDPNAFMEVMKNNGIDGIALVKEDATYYVIYNKDILK